MNYQEGKMKFITTWGSLGSNWGISRTMAQIHALLLISHSPVCADDVMNELQISRGNSNMSLRALREWGLIYKEFIKGDRKEYYVAEKDMWKIFCQIIKQRKTKELEPMIKTLQEISQVPGICDQSNEFCKMVRDLQLFSTKADQALDKITTGNSSILIGGFLNMMR